MKILDVPQSGSVGARTSSRNRGGQYVRQRSKPTQPRTASQVNQRARLTTAAAAWRGLTVAQRAAWIAFSLSFTVVNSLGTTIHLTGLQCYIKVNTVNVLLGRAAVAVPPVLPAFVACSVTGITAAFTGQTCAVQGVTTTAPTTHMLFASPQVSPGVSFQGNFRFLVGNSTYTAGTFSLATAYIAKFGALIATKQIFLKVVQEQYGMQDNGSLFSCIVGA